MLALNSAEYLFASQSSSVLLNVFSIHIMVIAIKQVQSASTLFVLQRPDPNFGHRRFA